MANLKTKEGRKKVAKFTELGSKIAGTLGEGMNPNTSLRKAWQPQDTTLLTEGSAKGSKKASETEIAMLKTYDEQKKAVDNIITRQTAENITLLRPDEGGTKKTKKKNVDPYYG
tara:strand:+ start:459 stop:800 length:342 start_codon:yes stop_codon:yes gene_type:complete